MLSLHKSLASMTLAAVVAAGCGGSEEAAPPPAPKVTAPAPAAAPAPAEAPAAAPAGETAAAPAGVDELHAKLLNTAWKVGDFEVNFIDAEKVLVKGGPLTSIAPNGLEAKYSYNAGTIEVSAMGTTKSGTWDGETLTVDGNAGVRK